MPLTTKKIRKTRYIYFVYRDPTENKQKHVCCGAENDPNAKKKALQLELDYLQNMTKEIDEKKKSIEKELSKIK